MPCNQTMDLQLYRSYTVLNSKHTVYFFSTFIFRFSSDLPGRFMVKSLILFQSLGFCIALFLRFIKLFFEAPVAFNDSRQKENGQREKGEEMQ